MQSRPKYNHLKPFRLVISTKKYINKTYKIELAIKKIIFFSFLFMLFFYKNMLLFGQI